MNDPILAELRTVICRIAMVSQATAMRLDSSARATDSDIGGNRPPGGVDRKGDRMVEFRQKSAEYFGHRLERCHTDRALEALLVEARQALWDWQHSPRMAGGLSPDRGSFEWKCLVADDKRDLAAVAAFYGVSARSVSRYRTDYRGVMSELVRGVEEMAA